MAVTVPSTPAPPRVDVSDSSARASPAFGRAGPLLY
jgi:hypothetical protein